MADDAGLTPRVLVFLPISHRKSQDASHATRYPPIAPQDATLILSLAHFCDYVATLDLSDVDHKPGAFL
jgi:hypothetical protein